MVTSLAVVLLLLIAIGVSWMTVHVAVMPLLLTCVVLLALIGGAIRAQS